MAPTEKLRPTERLRRSSEYLRVFRRGRCIRAAHLRVHYRHTNRDLSRLGLVVTKRMGNAVVRKRLKRLLREVFRRHKAALPATLDVVLVPQGVACDYDEYRVLFLRFAERVRERARPAAVR